MRGATPPLPDTPSWRGVQLKNSKLYYGSVADFVLASCSWS